jgi:Eukaryotic aspartyl protease
MVIEDRTCTNCKSTLFYSNESSTYALNSTDSYAINYGSASLQGFSGNDTVSLDLAKTVQATAFTFYQITSQTGISSRFDGILGMCRNGYGDATGPLLVESLFA